MLYSYGTFGVPACTLLVCVQEFIILIILHRACMHRLALCSLDWLGLAWLRFGHGGTGGRTRSHLWMSEDLFFETISHIYEYE